MNQVPVSEEMKAKLEAFRTESGSYDIEAVRVAYRAELDMQDANQRFNDIFAGFGDEDDTFEHNILTAAIQLNEEMEAQSLVKIETKTITVESPAGFEDMYISYEVETEEINQETIDAFLMREMSRSYGTSETDIRYAIREYVDNMSYATQNDKNPQSPLMVRQRVQNLLDIANRLFEKGYRLRKTDRVYNGIRIELPESAIVYRDVNADYIATNAAHRLIYIIKK